MKFKGFKRLAGALVSAALVSAQLVMPVGVSAADEIAYSNNGGGIVNSSDKMSETYDFGGDYGEVTKLVPNTSLSDKRYTERRFNMTRGNIIISFDFYAGQTDGMYSFIMRDTGGMNYAQFALDANGNFVVKRDAAGREYNPPDGMTEYPEKDYATYKYEAEKWYRADIVADTDEQSMSFYIDGNLVCTAGTSTQASGEYKLTYLLDWLYIAPPVGTDGDEYLYLDNFSISYFDKLKGFGVALSDRVGDDGYVLAQFDQKLDADGIKAASEAEIKNTKTGEALGIEEIVYDGNSIKYYTGEELEPGIEYAYILNNTISSISGAKLSDRYIYFMSQSDEEGNLEIFAEHDFESGKVHGNNITETARYNTTPADEFINGVSIQDTGDPEHGKALKFESSGKFQCIHYRITGDDIDKYDQAVLSFDVMFEQADSNYFTFYMRMDNLNAPPYHNGFYGVFNPAGKFAWTRACAKETDFILGDVSGNTSGFGQTEYTSDKWHNVRLVLKRNERNEENSADGVTYIYFDNQLVGKTKRLAENMSKDTKALLSDIRIETAESAAGAGDVMYVDNIRAGNYSSAGIKTMRIFGKDGKKYGPLYDETDVRSEGMYLYSDSPVSEASLSEETVVVENNGYRIPLSFGSYDKAEGAIPVYFEKPLNVDAQYKVTVSGLTTESGTPINEYQTYFKTSDTRGFYVDDFSIVDADGKEISDINSASGKLYLKTTLFNSDTEPETVTATAAVYSDFAMRGISSKDIIVEPLQEIIIDNINNPIEIDISDLSNPAAAAMLQDGEGAPIEEAVVLGGNGEFIPDAWTVNAEGVFENTPAGMEVNIELLLPGKTRQDAANISGDAFGETIAYRGRTTTGEDGAFKADFKIYDNPQIKADAVSGYYTLIASAQNKEIFTKEILFNNAQEMEEALNAVKEACEKEKNQAVSEIAKILEEKKFALGIDSGNFQKLDKSKIAQIIYITTPRAELTRERLRPSRKQSRLKLFQRDFATIFLICKKSLE